MTNATKKKLCWNCEGRVGFTEEHCPFCGVYLSPTPIPGGVSNDGPEEKVPKPPYQPGGEPMENSVHHSPYHETIQESKASKAENSEAVNGVNEELRKMITPMGTLLAGSIFFLFGLVLLLFSKDGKLTLQWSSDYWYVYLTFSLALLLWGWRSLQLVDE
ncbi:MAG: hypothetical protein AAGG81_00425 [Chlamydiota bacterium]